MGEDLFRSLFPSGGSNRPTAENSPATPIEPTFDLVRCSVMDFSRLLPVTVQAKICSDLFFEVGGSNRPAAENSSATPIEPKFDIAH